MIKRYSNRDDALATLPLSDGKEPLRPRDRFPPHALILYLLLPDRPAMLKRNLADLLLLFSPPFRASFPRWHFPLVSPILAWHCSPRTPESHHHQLFRRKRASGSFGHHHHQIDLHLRLRA